jgi:hypothetical protein
MFSYFRGEGLYWSDWVYLSRGCAFDYLEEATFILVPSHRIFFTRVSGDLDYLTINISCRAISGVSDVAAGSTITVLLSLLVVAVAAIWHWFIRHFVTLLFFTMVCFIIFYMIPQK